MGSISNFIKLTFVVVSHKVCLVKRLLCAPSSSAPGATAPLPPSYATEWNAGGP